MNPTRKRAGLKKLCLSVVLLISVYTAGSVPFMGQQAAAPQQSAATTTTAPQPNNEYLVGSTLWTQRSGEWRALAYQAYNFARLLLDQDLRTKRRGRMRRAVVVDIDETVLDNSPYQASLVREYKSYPQDWTAWINRSEAAPIPGAVEFLNYAHRRGVRVFYVTNRRSVEKEGTRANLLKLGFPDVSDETLIVRTDADSSSKEERRQRIARRYRIVLLIGDNLNDFAEALEKKTPAERIAATDQSKALFGARFIMLPNPMYGDWENAVYDYNFSLPDAQKVERRRSLLKSVGNKP
jgi:5'-nucleotidase (lipoprotein e(P4) family)